MVLLLTVSATHSIGSAPPSKLSFTTLCSCRCYTGD